MKGVVGWWPPMIPKRTSEPGVEAYLIMSQSLDCILQVRATLHCGPGRCKVSGLSHTITSESWGGAQESVFILADDSSLGHGTGTPGVVHTMGIGGLQGVMGRGGCSGVRHRLRPLHRTPSTLALTGSSNYLIGPACLPAADGAGQTPGASNSTVSPRLPKR